MRDLKQHISELVEQTVRQDIRDLNAYHVPAAKGLVKLDAMENPFALPDALREHWLEKLAQAELNRYPSASCEPVKKALFTAMKAEALQADYELVLGNGSDELIQIIIAACCDHEHGVLSVEPSFVMYKMIAQFMRVPYTGCDLNDDFSLDVAGIIRNVQENNIRVVFIAQPNNPTGNSFKPADIEAIISQTQALVVVDEAYLPFSEQDSLGLLNRYANVVVMRTLSKVGFAGLRLGFMFAANAWAEQFEKVRLPYNINVLTQISAEFLLHNYAVFVEQADYLKQQRAELEAALQNLPMVQEVFASEANFLLLRVHADYQAKALHGELQKAGVLIKCVDGGHRLLANCLRVTVSTAGENEQLIRAFKSLIV